MARTYTFETPTTSDEMTPLLHIYNTSKSEAKRDAVKAVFEGMVCEHDYITIAHGLYFFNRGAFMIGAKAGKCCPHCEALKAAVPEATDDTTSQSEDVSEASVEVSLDPDAVKEVASTLADKYLILGSSSPTSPVGIEYGRWKGANEACEIGYDLFSLLNVCARDAQEIAVGQYVMLDSKLQHNERMMQHGLSEQNKIFNDAMHTILLQVKADLDSIVHPERQQQAMLQQLQGDEGATNSDVTPYPLLMDWYHKRLKDAWLDRCILLSNENQSDNKQRIGEIAAAQIAVMMSDEYTQLEHDAKEHVRGKSAYWEGDDVTKFYDVLQDETRTTYRQLLQDYSGARAMLIDEEEYREVQNKALRLLEVRNGVTFLDCLVTTTESDFPKEWQRLTGKKLVATSPIEKMIDEATGYDKVILEEYVDDVYNVVFLTLYSDTVKQSL